MNLYRKPKYDPEPDYEAFMTKSGYTGIILMREDGTKSLKLDKQSEGKLCAENLRRMRQWK